MSGAPGNRRCTIGMGPVTLGVTSQDGIDALHAASGIAQALSDTMATHPALAPLMGPIVGPLTAINEASKAIKNGDYKHLNTALPVAASVVGNLLKGFL